MKPASFDYFSPSTLPQALTLMEEYGDEAKALAGGQSLVPMMNMRLVRPRCIIDINRVGELDYIRDNDGGLSIGALTRQRTVENSPLVRSRCPLLFETVPNIANFQIRNRGTVGGSLVHADPAADIPAVVSVLGAELIVASSQGERVIPAEEFFVTYFTTSMEPSELLQEIRFPPWPARRGSAFMKVSRRHGDFALVGIAAHLTLDQIGTCTDAGIAFLGVGGTPVRTPQAEDKLVGSKVEDEIIEQAAGQAMEEIEPESDVHASAEYRRHVTGVLLRRALKIALERAKGKDQHG